jgi:hypothetical protein
VVAEIFKGEAAHCFPSHGAHNGPCCSRLSRLRAVPVRVQIGTTLRVTAIPKLPLLPFALAIMHTHADARARVTATANDRTQAVARAC